LFVAAMALLSSVMRTAFRSRALLQSGNNKSRIFSFALWSKDAQDADARRQRKEAELNALNSGVSVIPENSNGHRTIATAAKSRRLHSRPALSVGSMRLLKRPEDN
jgi:hypothetical protein